MAYLAVLPNSIEYSFKKLEHNLFVLGLAHLELGEFMDYFHLYFLYLLLFDVILYYVPLVFVFVVKLVLVHIQVDLDLLDV